MHPALALYERNAWANREVLRACAGLDPEVLRRPCPASYGPVEATLAHIVRGEQNYLKRLTGEDPGEWIVPDRPPGLERLAALAEEGTGRMRAVLAAGPDPERLVWGQWRDRRIGVTDWVILVQHVHHGDDHRAQIGTALGAAGIEPAELSATEFVEAGPTTSAGVAAGPWADAVLARFLGHSVWASGTLLEHCRGLGDDVLAATTPGTYGTLQETLTHMLDTDARLVGLLTGDEHVELERSAPLDVLRTCAERAREGWRAYLASAADPERAVASRYPGSAAWMLVLQAVYHANEHRAQACSILGAHGLTHPDLDCWAYGGAEGALPDAGPA